MRRSDTSSALVPPHSEQLEQSLLGALLVGGAAAWEAAEPVLAGRAVWYFPEHAAIHATIRGLMSRRRPVDVVTVFDAGGHELAYLNDLAQCVPAAGSAGYYAARLAELWSRRELLRVAAELHAAAMAEALGDQVDDVAAIVDRTAGDLLRLAEGREQRGPVPVREVMEALMQHLEDLVEGRVSMVETGLRDVDAQLGGGIRGGELIVLGARPSMGKSAQAGTIALHVARSWGVLLLTQEDSLATWGSRAVANVARVNLSDLRNPVHAKDPERLWSGLAEAADSLQERALLLDDQAGLTLADVRRKVQQAKRALLPKGATQGRPLKLVVVDYLQLMTGDKDNRNQLLGEISNGLKRLAKDEDMTVLLLSQLSRKADEMPMGQLPQMHHLRDSGDIEGAADVVMLLHREAQRRKTGENAQWAQLNVAKNKNGSTGVVNLYFDGAYQRFENWDGPVPSFGPGSGAAKSGGYGGGGLS